MKTPQALKDMYGKEYAEDFDRTKSPFRLERLLKFINFDAVKDAVDLACGNGLLMPYIVRRGISYTGVDFSEDFIRIADMKKKNLGARNARFECSSIQEFCGKHPDSFDAGFAMDFSEHVYDQDWLDILRGVRVSLRNGGRLYLHTPNAEFFLEIMKNHDFIVKQPPPHIAVRTPAENVRLLERAGFRVNKVRLLAHYNSLRYLHPLSYIPVVGSYLKARIFIEASK